jgi:nitroreductase
MRFIDLVRTRRSVRRYTQEPLAREHIDLLKEVAVRSPTSRNRRPWRFVFVTEKEMLKKLSDCKPHGAAFLQDAALGVVICADTAVTDVWVEDCSIASVFLQLAAQELGLGSCWIQVRNREHASGISASEYLSTTLSLNRAWAVESIIAIGHPAEFPEPVPVEQLAVDQVLP